MKVQNNIISVFRTSVATKHLSKKIITEILLFDSVIACNFDLQDRDKIMRIVSQADVSEKVIAHLQGKGFFCEELN